MLMENVDRESGIPNDTESVEVGVGGWGVSGSLDKFSASFANLQL